MYNAKYEGHAGTYVLESMSQLIHLSFKLVH